MQDEQPPPEGNAEANTPGQYSVGYRKPPQHSRFKPGESGNPKGKPRGAKNLSTIVGNAIKEKVQVTENGKRRSVSKLEVAIKQLVNKAAAGDQKALNQLLPLVQIIEGKAAEAVASIPIVHEADEVTMESIRRRIMEATQSPQIPITTDERESQS